MALHRRHREMRYVSIGHFFLHLYFLNKIAKPAAQYNADGWFMGVTKNLVCATWVGADDPSVRFRNGWYGQGAMMAMPIYGKFLKSAVNDKSLNLTTDALDPPQNPTGFADECSGSVSGDEIEVNGLGD